MMALSQEPYDVFLTSCATGEAPADLNTTGIAKLALIWTTTHVPAISIPRISGTAWHADRRYLVGKRNEDRALFSAARWVQRALS
jgi:hypothetical protein